MAQLKATTVNGALTATGNIVSNDGVIIGSGSSKMKISNNDNTLATLIVSSTDENIGAPAKLQLGTDNSNAGTLTLSNYTSPTQAYPNGDIASIHFIRGTGNNKKEAFLVFPNVGDEDHPKTIATTEYVDSNGGAKIYDYTVGSV